MPPCFISSRKETFELATILHGLAGLRPVRLAGGRWLGLICFERKVLLAGC
jgi:hypothetical protein